MPEIVLSCVLHAASPTLRPAPLHLLQAGHVLQPLAQGPLVQRRDFGALYQGKCACGVGDGELWGERSPVLPTYRPTLNAPLGDRGHW